MLSISVLIPLIGYKEITKTIDSVIKQRYKQYEILILRNDIDDLPEGINVVEKENRFQNGDIPIKEVLIRAAGKGIALNEGISRASGELIAVLDADCILEEGALFTAAKHFEEKKVVAVGGRLLVMQKDGSLLERIQSYEYMKAFEIGRPLFAWLNAQCLISGAFGLFRKSALSDIGGYDTDTVGEDMELVLRLQEDSFFRNKMGIVYEPKAVCVTEVPLVLKRLFRQRDRWQRGLLDCLRKHMKMILNPFYGLLGILTLVYQVLFEFLGPVWCLLYFLWPLFRENFPKVPSWGLVYTLFQFVISVFAAFRESDYNLNEVLRRIPWLAIITVISAFYQMIFTAARFYGIITFRWRRLVW